MSLDNSSMQFPAGQGTLFIKNRADRIINDPSSTKQAPNSSTGLGVIARDDGIYYYLHNMMNLRLANLSAILTPAVIDAPSPMDQVMPPPELQPIEPLGHSAYLPMIQG